MKKEPFFFFKSWYKGAAKRISMESTKLVVWLWLKPTKKYKNTTPKEIWHWWLRLDKKYSDTTNQTRNKYKYEDSLPGAAGERTKQSIRCWPTVSLLLPSLAPVSPETCSHAWSSSPSSPPTTPLPATSTSPPSLLCTTMIASTEQKTCYNLSQAQLSWDGQCHQLVASFLFKVSHILS